MPVPGTDGEVGVSRIGERTRPRVLVLAPRQNMLPGKSSRSRGRNRQHARRVRSPKFAIALAAASRTVLQLKVCANPAQAA